MDNDFLTDIIGMPDWEVLYAQEVQEVFVTVRTGDALALQEAGAAAIALGDPGNASLLGEQLAAKPTTATLLLWPDADKNYPRQADLIEMLRQFTALNERLQLLGIPCVEVTIEDERYKYAGAEEYLQADREAFCATVADLRKSAKKKAAELMIEAQRAAEERKTRTGAGMVDAFLQEIRTTKYKPVPTGIAAIDKATDGGFTRQQLILLGAAPGAGKTALAQWIFEGMAKNGHPCVFLNLEMSREQILARAFARLVAQRGVKMRPAQILQGYQWTADQEKAVLAAADEYRRTIAAQMIYNPDGVTTNLDSIMEYLEAEATRAESAGLYAPSVVLDYLQIVEGNPKEDNTAVIKRTLGSLKRYAIRHNTFVFAITAHNRGANKSGDVTMESGRDTSALEYGADLQLGLAYTLCLKRGKQEPKDKDDLTAEEMQFVTLKVTKGRFAEPRTAVDLYFDGKTMTYSPAEEHGYTVPQGTPRAGFKL